MARRKLTPSRKQYLDMKAQHPDSILFFRMGDFYEMFDDDARTAAKALDIILTSRSQKGDRIPMCGVPHHAAEGYIARLIGQGFKVALCEQMGSTPINGLMPREVVRVFTAGTIIEPGMLDAVRNNYLVAVISENGRSGLAYADITTGQFATTVVETRRTLIDELARLAPAELLIADNEHSLLDVAKSVTPIARWRFEEGNGRKTLLRHFNVSTLAGFGCENKPMAIRAAGGLLHYLQETQRGAMGQITRLSTYNLDGYMALDAATRRNLELTESLGGERTDSLLGILDKTSTAMGARLLRERVKRPLLHLPDLNQRLDQVETFHANPMLRAESRAILKKTADLERLANRLLSGKANPRDLEQIRLTLEIIPDLTQLLSTTTASPATTTSPEPVEGRSPSTSTSQPSTSSGFVDNGGRSSTSSGFVGDGDQPSTSSGFAVDPLASLIANLNPCDVAADIIQRAIAEDAPINLNKMGVIQAGFSAELDGVMNSSAHARAWVADLEPRERARTGVNSLKIGFNKVFGYYIELTKANAHLAPDDYIRKQTLTNAERYITPELKEYETLILNAEERILDIERRVFGDVCQQVAIHAPCLLATAQTLARLDVAQALAQAAADNGYVRPSLLHGEGEVLMVENGRHPVVEQSNSMARFVPNSIHFSEKERIQIITGPNMSGKSTYLRQIALIALMAQIGSYVPADSATINLVDRIFTRIGAHDELHAGRSTFMVEMVEAAEILNHATHRSLLILDEIGRGTSTYDGLSLAWAIVEYLHNHPRLKPRTLFATHYHELVGLADMLPMVANYNVAVAEEGDSVAFLHQIVAGGADRSYGIHVAQLAGLPRDVINRANEILAILEDQAVETTVKPDRLTTAQQSALFPASSPMLDELTELDVNSLTPLEAINKLYEWKRRYAE